MLFLKGLHGHTPKQSAFLIVRTVRRRKKCAFSMVRTVITPKQSAFLIVRTVRRCKKCAFSMVRTVITPNQSAFLIVRTVRSSTKTAFPIVCTLRKHDFSTRRFYWESECGRKREILFGCSNHRYSIEQKRIPRRIQMLLHETIPNLYFEESSKENRFIAQSSYATSH